MATFGQYIKDKVGLLKKRNKLQYVNKYTAVKFFMAPKKKFQRRCITENYPTTPFIF